jgi:nucleoside-diphosphate-sugar epimerase
LRQQVEKPKALIAGAAGFIGLHIARKLLDRDGAVL